MRLMLWEKSDILSDNVIDYIGSNWDREWFHSGNVTNPESLKKNLQMDQNNIFQNYYEAAMKELTMSKCMNGVFLCTKQAIPLFSWYHEGDQYGYHIDDYPIRNVYPNLNWTCYLNDDFEGGELVVRVGNMEVITKPEKGKFIIYDSSLYHRVNPVTKGDRRVMIGFMESEIKDSYHRNLAIDYALTSQSILAKIRPHYDEDQQGYIDIKKELLQFRYSLLRNYGRSD